MDNKHMKSGVLLLFTQLRIPLSVLRSVLMQSQPSTAAMYKEFCSVLCIHRQCTDTPAHQKLALPNLALSRPLHPVNNAST